MSKNEEKNMFLHAKRDILAGTMGGIAQVITGHPLDTVKVRLQGDHGQFKGMADCFRQTVVKEGLTGLYKGAWSPLIGAMAHNAGLFFSFGQAKLMIAKHYGKNVTELNLGQTFLAGAIAGCFISIIECPIDLIKIKMQIQLEKEGGKYANVFDCTRQLVRESGLRGLYQGVGVTALRNTPCFALYFTFFEAVSRALTPRGEKPTLSTTALAGAAAGFGFWGLLYPLDVIKTKLQSDPHENRKYHGLMDCVRKTYEKGGMKAFFKGYAPSILRAIPLNCCLFLAVTYTKRIIWGV